MNRRRFLEGSAQGLSALLWEGMGIEPSRGACALGARELAADVLVIGGGLGGCAAALAALRAGRTVIMTEPTDWVGGQITQQAVPPDEHPWIEQFGCNASYRALRDGIRDYYRRHYPLTAEASSSRALDPGNGGVSALCHEPRVALAVLTAMLAPHASAGRLTVLLEHAPIAAETQGDKVQGVTVKDLRSGDERALIAPYVIDASELGDLLPLAGVEFVTGFESREKTGEPKGAAGSEPENQQAFTCCFAVEYREGEDHTIEKPEEYAFWRDYVPALQPAWPGKLLSLTYTHPVTLKPITQRFNPQGEGEGLWVYRRIQYATNFRPGAFPGSAGMTLVNWPQNDYWLGNLVGVSAAEALNHLKRAKQLSLSLLFWLQTECPRPDGQTGWKGLKLRPDVVGTQDGLAKYPYIRESRRIVAEFTVTEQQVGTEARRAQLGREDVEAEQFDDTVGVGSYRIDLHPSSGGDNYIDVSSLPFQIPLGALLPVRMENLIAGAKNLGTTHITNGCYRLHPVEWGIGEAAGALASFALDKAEMPRAIRNTPLLLRDFQTTLKSQGVEIQWPRVSPR